MGDLKATLHELLQCMLSDFETADNVASSSTDNQTKFQEILQDFLKNEDDILEPEKITGGGMRALQGNLDKVIHNKRPEKIKGISTTIVSEGKTLAQYIAEKDLALYLPVLLKEGVNPNFVDDSKCTPFNEKLPPILLAAKHGNASILKEFKRHNDEYIRQISSLSSVNELQRKSINIADIISTGTLNSTPLQTLEDDFCARTVFCKFSALTEHGESLLHLLLKSPIQNKFKTAMSRAASVVSKTADGSLHNAKEEAKNKREEEKMKIRKKYESCLDIILSLNTSSKWLAEEIRFVKQHNGRIYDFI